MPNCKRCGKLFTWKKTTDGRWAPINLDGSSHFNTCPYVEKFKGKSFYNKNVDYTKIPLPKGQTRLI